MWKRSLFVILAAQLCLVELVQAGEEDLNAEQLEEIEDSINRVKKEVTDLNQQRGEVREELESSEIAIAATRKQISSLNQQIVGEQKTLASLQEQAAALDQQRKEQQALLGQYMKAAWISGEGEYLKLLLNQRDPAAHARLSRYYAYFSTARAGRIATFNDTLAQLSAVSADLAASTAKLSEQQQALEAQQQTLAGRQTERTALLARLETEVSSRNNRLNQLEQQRVEIQLVLAELRRSMEALALSENAQPFADKKGQLPWPLDGRVLHTFGSKHEFGDLTYEGVTIAAKAGTPIMAIHPGRVVFADWLGSSGLLLIIDHGDGYMSLYAHNQELYKPVGTWVGRGDTIAAVGDSGGQREPGLYFEIRRDGKAENPVNWCIPRNSSSAR
jgi:septal ring factor EnvC (AmiA/AmiB activator)